MAANVCTAADASEILYQEKAKADALLRDILAAIDSVTDERQKAVLTMRYINGDPFLKISEALFLSEPAVYIAHGRALVAVNKWLEGRKDAEIRQATG
jgi:DNA-directed RNA polymerase specialized sigma24 family protein